MKCQMLPTIIILLKKNQTFQKGFDLKFPTKKKNPKQTCKSN